MNLSSNSSEFEPYKPTYASLVTSAVYMTFLIIIGAIGNILVIIGVLMSPRLRSHSFHVFTINLSVADLGVNLVVIPLGLKSLFNYGWPHDAIACRIIFYLNIITIAASLETLALVALNRYFLITKPRQTYMKFCGMKPIAATIFAIWINVILLAILPELGFGVFHYDPYLRVCYVDNSDLSTWWYINGIVIFGVVTFFLTIPILYILTFCAVRASKLRVHPQMQPNADANAAVHHPDGRVHQIAKNEKAFQISKNEIRITQIIALISVVLIECWSPLFIVHFFKKHFVVPVAIQRAALLLVYTNSSVNPYLYALLNKNFKLAYKKILSCR